MTGKTELPAGAEFGRRDFIRSLTGAAAVLTLPPALILPNSAEAATAGGSVRKISLVAVNTDEQFSGVYWADGRYVPEAMKKIDRLLRDYKAGQTYRIDPKLIDQLWELNRRLGLDEPFEIVCGYRSRQTNAIARRRSSGVAKQSLHMSGRAVDIRIHDKSIKALATAARAMKSGGVGYYPRSGFVHIDTGAVRTW